MAPEATHEAHVVEDGHTGWRMKNKLLDCGTLRNATECYLQYIPVLQLKAYRVPVTAYRRCETQTAHACSRRKQASKQARTVSPRHVALHAAAACRRHSCINVQLFMTRRGQSCNHAHTSVLSAAEGVARSHRAQPRNFQNGAQIRHWVVFRSAGCRVSRNVSAELF